MSRIILSFIGLLSFNHIYSQTPFYYEDFNNGFAGSNGAWTVTGTESWKYSFYGTSGQFSAGIPQPQFSTVQNGFAIFDGDSINFPLSPNYTNCLSDLISPTIDMSAYATVFMEFESYFKTDLDSSIIVRLSADNGTTWNTVLFANFNILPDSLSPNPMVVQIDVSPFVASQAACKVEFSWSDMSHYFWAVDGVGFYQSAPPNPWTTVNENGSLKSYFTIYPNPSNDKVTVEFFNETNEFYALELTDLMGKTLSLIKGEASGTIQKNEFDVSNLSAGNYFIKYTDKNAMRFKLIQVF